MRRLGAWITRVLRAGRGRPAALVLLAGLSVLICLPEHSPFKPLRLALFDNYQVWLPRPRLSGPVTIVSIDESSLKQFGQWPWPRTRLAELIQRIAAQQPLAIGLDIIMPEHDLTSPEALAAALPAENAALKRELAALPAHDAVLAATMRTAPVVLGAAGFDFATPSTSEVIRAWPVQVKGGDAIRYVHRYPHVLASLPDLQAAASGQALLSTELDKGVVRRVPMLHAVGETLVPALALELLRVATGAAAVVTEVDRNGIAAMSVGDLRVPTQSNSEVWVHFSHFLPERYVSARDVMLGPLNPEVLHNKLVLVALTGIGLTDYKTTPRGEWVPGVDVHAQLLESFFDQRVLLRPRWMPWIELALLVGGGFALIWAVPKVRPRIATLFAVAMFAVLLSAGFALFHWGAVLFDAASVAGSLNIVFVSLLGSVFIESDRERRRAERALQRERESAARVTGELEAARSIQMGILPDAENAFPDEHRFELAATLESARTVGGDLYDFFMLDQRRLFFLIGDVSGKGVPASLFMSISKVLTKSAALRERGDPGKILTQANLEIARDNPQAMFVTAFAGVLDVDTGVLDYWNAGHDPPLRRAAVTEPLASPNGGPPLCVFDDYRYDGDRTRLAPGETLVLFTDGITEANDLAGALYGKQRLTQALQPLPPSATAQDTLAAVRADVAAFIGAAEPSDDLTVLVIRWLGKAGGAGSSAH